jgi:hypothetical protein
LFFEEFQAGYVLKMSHFEPSTPEGLMFDAFAALEVPISRHLIHHLGGILGSMEQLKRKPVGIFWFDWSDVSDEIPQAHKI